jgi:hypothetical protein
MEPDLMFSHCMMAQPLPEPASSSLVHQNPNMTSSKASRMCVLAHCCASLHSIARRIAIVVRYGDGEESWEDSEADLMPECISVGCYEDAVRKSLQGKKHDQKECANRCCNGAQNEGMLSSCALFVLICQRRAFERVCAGAWWLEM